MEARTMLFFFFWEWRVRWEGGVAFNTEVQSFIYIRKCTGNISSIKNVEILARTETLYIAINRDHKGCFVSSLCPSLSSLPVLLSLRL